MFCPKCDSESRVIDGVYVCTFCGFKHDGSNFFEDSSAYGNEHTDLYLTHSSIGGVFGV